MFNILTYLGRENVRKDPRRPFMSNRLIYPIENNFTKYLSH